MQETARGDDVQLQLTASQQQCLTTEDDGRLLKRQLAVMTKARDVARQEKEDWKATCNRSATVIGPRKLHAVMRDIH